jgi:hypothetical protein
VRGVDAVLRKDTGRSGRAIEPMARAPARPGPPIASESMIEMPLMLF